MEVLYSIIDLEKIQTRIGLLPFEIYRWSQYFAIRSIIIFKP